MLTKLDIKYKLKRKRFPKSFKEHQYLTDEMLLKTDSFIGFSMTGQKLAACYYN